MHSIVSYCMQSNPPKGSWDTTWKGIVKSLKAVAFISTHYNTDCHIWLYTGQILYIISMDHKWFLLSYLAFNRANTH